MERRKFVKSLLLAPMLSLIPRRLLATKSDPEDLNVINISELGGRSDLATFDNREVIQKAIDVCAENYAKDNKIWSIFIPQGIFYMSATSYFDSVGGKQVGVCCLILKSNIRITGPGTLKVKDHQYGAGAFFRMLGSYRNSDSNLKNVEITEITLDGNSANQTSNIQASNLLLECSENIVIKGVKSINANGNGILLRGEISHEKAAKNIEVTNCIVDRCAKIGIQVSQFNGLIIDGNAVSNCRDNGIDLYGDMGNGSYPNVNGNNFIIRNNHIIGCATGIFPETVANGDIYNNQISNSVDSGLHVNRIHGLPQNIMIRGNSSVGSDYGITLTGDMKNININDNNFQGVRKSFIRLGGGNGNASNISASRNHFLLGNETQSIVTMGGIQISKINITENVIVTSQKDQVIKQMMISNSAKKVDNSVIISNWKIMK